MKKIAVFGSLKQGFWNHTRFGLGEPLTKGQIRGAMYLCFGYPHLYREEVVTSDLVRSHEVEIYEVEDGVFDAIESMEHGAGYQTVDQIIEGDDGEMHVCKVFYTRDNHTYRSNWIEEYSKEALAKITEKDESLK